MSAAEKASRYIDYAQVIRDNAYHREWCDSQGPPGDAEDDLCDCNRRELIASLEALSADTDRFKRALKAIADDGLNILEARELIEWVVEWARDPEDCFDYSRADKQRFGKETGRV